MKKLLFVIFLGVLIYSCSEVNEPVNVNDNVGKISPDINTLQINKKVGSPSILADTVARRVIFLSDSVNPPNGKTTFCDSCVSSPRGIIILGDSVNPPNSKPDPK